VIRKQEFPENRPLLSRFVSGGEGEKVENDVEQEKKISLSNLEN
jgi:hypothetical protein